MPELPEVETIKNELKKTVCGKKILRVEILNPKVIRQPSPGEFKKALENLKVKDIFRRGKLLVAELSDGRFLTVHLKLTGQLVFQKSFSGKRNSADSGSKKSARRVTFYFRSGPALDFNDQRLFGELRLLDDWKKLKFIQRLGPEPLELSYGDFESMLLKRKTEIKPLLMDQSFIAGIGNIYAAEILFFAGVNPRCPAKFLDKNRRRAVYSKMRMVLKKAVRYGGSSVDDYVRVSGENGKYAQFHRVYGREGKPCFVCSTPISRIVQGSRGTYFCPRCQPLPAGLSRG